MNTSFFLLAAPLLTGPLFNCFSIISFVLILFSKFMTLAEITVHIDSLKGPKLDLFGSRVFMQSKPVWVGDLGTRLKNLNFDGLKIAILYFFSVIA
jgi:hypothetical protein